MKIMLTTDGSDCSHHAIQEALRLLPTRDAEVALVGVTPPPMVGMDPLMGYGLNSGLADSQLLEQEVLETHHHMAEARRILNAAGIQATEIEREGDPAAAILLAAKDFQPDVLVMGSHGRGAVERLLLGSVSDAVVHHHHGAVLVVRPPA